MNKSEKFYESSVNAVSNACKQYWLNGSIVPFTDKLVEDAVVIGLNIFKEHGSCQFLEQKYNTQILSEELCIVAGHFILCNNAKNYLYRVDSDITVLCKNTSEGICFLGVHMSSNRRRLINAEAGITTDYYYRKLMDSLCDVFMEAKGDSVEFKFDKERYYNLFHEYYEFDTMDDWFWHICENFVLEQDLEKLDLFRESDIEKRIKNNDLLIDTTFRINRDVDETIWVNMKIVFIPNEESDNVNDVFVLLKDCTAEMTEKMRNIKYARVDGLTRIWNRRYAMELIEESIYSDRKGIFVLFDVDKFKTINDLYGHMTGDDILIKITSSITSSISDKDVFGRLGGDEFVLFLKRSDDMEADKKRVQEIIGSTRFNHCEKGIVTDVHCSAGAVFFDNGRTTFEELYQKADAVMYEAKASGRDNVKIEIM